MHAVRIEGLQFETLNYLVVRTGEPLLFKVAPGESRMFQAKGYASDHLFDLGAYSVFRLEATGP